MWRVFSAARNGAGSGKKLSSGDLSKVEGGDRASRLGKELEK